MEKKSVLLVMFAVILLSLSFGCATKTPATTGGAPEAVYKGYAGVEMSFMKSLPPDKSYDTAPLDIMVELANKGVYDVTGRCQLYLYGYDENIITGLVKTQSCGDLEAKTQYNPEGGRNTLSFYTENIYLPEEIDALPQNFVVTACYEYQTVANPVVCIDPKLYDPFPYQRACAVQDVSVSGGQGAPVSVDKVQVEMMKQKVLFKISISNKGAAAASSKRTILSKNTQSTVKGTVLSPASSIINGCPFNLEYNDYNIVDYEVDMTGGSLIKCSPEIDGTQRIRLVDNKGVIYCYFTVPENQPAYTTPLNIFLEYNYMESVSKSVQILKTP